MKSLYVKPAMQVTDISMDDLLQQSQKPVQDVTGNSDLIPGEGTDDTGRARSYSVWDDEL